MPIAIKGKGVIDPPFKSGAYMKEDRQSPNCMLRFYEPTYRTRAIITRSWFDTVLYYKSRTLDPKIEEFPCWVHKLSVTLTALQYKPLKKLGYRIYKSRVIMAHVWYVYFNSLTNIFSHQLSYWTSLWFDYSQSYLWIKEQVWKIYSPFLENNHFDLVNKLTSTMYGHE